MKAKNLRCTEMLFYFFFLFEKLKGKQDERIYQNAN